MMTDSRFTNASGYATWFGKILATFMISSLTVSALEALLKRRAVFVHVGFFAASLLIVVLFTMLPIIPGTWQNVANIKYGLYLYVILSTLVFAVTGMLSPRNNP
jgi:surface polysaccharide O-acyltransferase-like enzyme